MTFVTVIQVTEQSFKVIKFEGKSQRGIYPQTSQHGVVVSCLESNAENDAHCEEMAGFLNRVTTTKSSI